MPATSSSSSSSESDVPNKTLKRKIDPSDSGEDSSSDESDGSETAKDTVKKISKRDVSTDEDDNDEKEGREEVEVLSHADKRRQKKRQKLEETSSSTKPNDEKSNSKKEGAGLGDDKSKRQNSVWVGNLSFKTTPESLRTFFEGVGQITRVHMPMKLASGLGGADKQKGKWAVAGAKENRGFAYVDFATPDGKTLAIICSEKNLDGRRLLIKDGDDFTGRPAAPTATTSADTTESASKAPNLSGHSKTAQKILSAQKQPPGPALFLGNLGFETTVESITEMIGAHHRVAADANGKKVKKDGVDGDGEGSANVEEGSGSVKDKKSEVGIRKVRMGTFEDSGLCKGFAFVDFISVEHATAVLINPRNHKLNGRQLVVEYASPDAVRRGGHREKGAGTPNGQKKFETAKTEGRRRMDEGDGESRWSRRGGDMNEVDGSFTHRRGEKGAKDGYAKRRPKPGAALALAKRENVAIVPSEGTRITF